MKTTTLLLAGVITAFLFPMPVESQSLSNGDYALCEVTGRDGRFRTWVSLEDISPALIDATLHYEDRRFLTHRGVDLRAVARAARATASGNRRQGASTLSMQLVRLRDGLDTTTATGKLVQMARAVQLERHYGKDEILEAYLNLAPYGRNIESVGAAAWIWFGKAPAELALPEAAALAVLPQNPGGRNPDRAEGLARIDEARARLAREWPDVARRGELVAPITWRGPSGLPFRAPHFVDALLADRSTPRGGEVVTTLDPGTQVLTEVALGEWIAARHPHGIENAAVLVVDYRDMSVRAWVGSAGFFDESISGQVDAVRARRSPGSVLKPFLYGLAVDQGLIHPYTLLEDSPTRHGLYAPENFDGAFEGPVLARDALVRSRNVPAVQLMSMLQGDALHGLLRTARVRGLQAPGHYGLALALGAMEIGMDEVATLYAALAHRGHWRPLRIRADAGSRDGVPVLSPEAAFIVDDMLRGTAGWALKTGTSWGFRDARTAGVVGHHVVVVWVGHFDGRPDSALVGRLAAQPLFERVATALGDTEVRPVAGGLNLARIDMCAVGGNVAGRHCPRVEQGWFVPGVSPLRVNDIHREVPVEVASGTRACAHQPPHTRLEVFEFWPSHLRAIFARGGVVRRAPPVLGRDCALGSTATGRPPVILSPTVDVEYVVREESGRPVPLPLRASVDAEVSAVFWFADDRLLGRVDAGETLFWDALPGRHRLRVVDDHGRTAVQTLVVVEPPVSLPVSGR